MKITALKEQVKNPDRVSIFVDETYSFSLTLSEVLDYKVRVGNDVSPEALENLKKRSADGKIRARAYEWLLNRPHSTKELRDYLRRKKVDADTIDQLVTEFTAKNVLSDERFSEWFTERAQRKHKSVRATQNELRGKGVPRELLGTVSAASNDAAALGSLIQKLAGRPRYSDQARLIRYLQGKGFAYGDIKTALNLRLPEQEP